MVLYEDAIKLSINKHISDVRLLLQWAEEEPEVHKKILHVEQALRNLAEVAQSLSELR